MGGADPEVGGAGSAKGVVPVEARLEAALEGEGFRRKSGDGGMEPAAGSHDL